MKRALNNINTIFSKELLETLRDRRTLILTVFLPIILYPLLILGMSQAVVLQIGKLEKKKINIAVKGKSSLLVDILEKDDRFALVDSESVRARVRSGQADLGIEIPKDFDAKISTDGLERPRLLIYYSQTSEKSRLCVRKLQNLIRQLSDRQVKSRLKALGQQPESFLQPFRIVVEDTAKAKEQGAFELGRVLALLLVMMAVSFTLYPAIDMAAGEKERGTMETLLISSASRLEIVLGKYLAVFSIALLGSVLNLISMGLTFGHFASMASREMQGMKGTSLSREHEAPVNFVAFSGENRAVSADKDGLAVYWDLKSREKIHVWKAKKLSCFALHPSKRFVVAGTEAGALLRWDFTCGKSCRVWKGKNPVDALCFSHMETAALSTGDSIVIVDCHDWKTVNTVVGGKLLAFSPRGDRLAIVRDALYVVDCKTGKASRIPVETTIAAFSLDSKYLLCGSKKGALSLYLAKTGDRVWPVDTQGLQAHNAEITALKFGKNGKIVSAGADSIICTWNFLKKTLSLVKTRALKGNSPALAVDMENDACLSGSGDGTVELWKAGPGLSFSLSFSVFTMILMVLIPLLGLFAAISLALSVFAQSYKEAQYYLTPLMIVVMPLAMISLIPAVTLTPARCFIPVTGVVLLYKELFMGQINWPHISLVLGSNLLYAVLALVFAVRLFQQESVLFRESEERKWEFWSAEGKKQEVFTFNQAIGLMCLTMVLYHFVGPYFATWNFWGGQAINQIAFLVVFPLLGAMLFRLDVKKTFHLKLPRLKYVWLAVPAALCGAVVARELSVLQRKLLPMDMSALQRVQEMFEKQLDGTPIILVLAVLSLLPGVCEELFFRGALLSSCRRQMKPATAIGITAFFFAVMHMNFPNFTFYLVLGLILGYLVVCSGSILPSMIAHLCNNAFAVLASIWLQGSELEKTVADNCAFLPWQISLTATLILVGCLLALRPQAQSKHMEHKTDR